MAQATASDVRIEIDTGLSDSDISDIISRVEREINRAYDNSPGYDDTDHQSDFEAALTALRIAEGRDRRSASENFNGTQVDYEADEIAQLRKRVRRDDPGDAFGHAGSVRRDTNRHISTSN